MDRNCDVAEDQEQQDSPDEVVDVRPADGDVAGPPAHLGPDHVGARPDESEGDEKGDEEEEMRLAARCRRSRAGRRSPMLPRPAWPESYGIGIGPARSSWRCRCRPPPRQVSLPGAADQPVGAAVSDQDVVPVAAGKRVGPPPPTSRSGESPADQPVAPRASGQRPRLPVDHAADHHGQVRVGVEGVAAAAEVADDRADVARRRSSPAVALVSPFFALSSPQLAPPPSGSPRPSGAVSTRRPSGPM